MKKILVTSLALLAACVAHANTGFYVGAKIGPSFNTGEFKSYDTANPIDIHSAKGGAGSAFFGGINLGYGYVTCSDWYVGVDANFLFHSLNNEVRKSTSSANGLNNPKDKLKNDFFWGAALHLGYQMCNKVIPYVSLGFLSGEYKLRVINDTTATRGLATNTTYDVKKTVCGFNPGLGVKFKIDDCFTASMQYDVLFGQKVARTFTDSGSWHYFNKVTQHNVSFTVAYIFY